MPHLPWRRLLLPIVAASILAGTAAIGTTMAPPRAAAITCSVVTKCYTLTIAYNGIGDVNVVATSGISCRLFGTVTSGTCSARYYAGTAIEIDTTVGMHTCVTLPSGSLPCSTGKNEPSMMPAYNVTYTIFSAYERAILVTITKTGTGTGHVASDYPGIDCGSLCSEYQPGHVDDGLSEQPDAGSVFAGWSGGCSGTNSSCSFNATSAIGVTATFNKVATPPPSATPKPTPQVTPIPSPTPKPTGTPGTSQTAPPTATPTPLQSAGHTPSPTLPPGATPTPTSPGSSEAAPATEGPPPASGAEASAGASIAANSSPADSGVPGSGATGAASSTAATSGPGSPVGTSGDGGLPIGVVGLVVLLVIVVAGGVVFGARSRRRS